MHRQAVVGLLLIWSAVDLWLFVGATQSGRYGTYLLSQAALLATVLLLLADRRSVCDDRRKSGILMIGLLGPFGLFCALPLMALPAAHWLRLDKNWFDGHALTLAESGPAAAWLPLDAQRIPRPGNLPKPFSETVRDGGLTEQEGLLTEICENYTPRHLHYLMQLMESRHVTIRTHASAVYSFLRQRAQRQTSEAIAAHAAANDEATRDVASRRLRDLIASRLLDELDVRLLQDRLAGANAAAVIGRKPEGRHGEDRT